MRPLTCAPFASGRGRPQRRMPGAPCFGPLDVAIDVDIAIDVAIDRDINTGVHICIQLITIEIL